MKVLISHSDTKIRDLLEFIVESQFQAQTLVVDSTPAAILALEKKNDFQIIISGETESSLDRKIIQQWAEKSAPQTALLFVDFTPNDAKTFDQVQADLIARLKKEFKKNQVTEKETVPAPEYCRVRASIALRTGLLKCDLFVKMKDDHYVKVFREGDLLDLLDLGRFESKKIEHFYIKTENVKLLIDRLSNEFKRLSDQEELSFESQIQISTTTLEMISDFSQSCGFNEPAQKLTQLSIQLAIKTIQKNPELNELYTKIQVHPDRYLVSHSVLLAHVACGMASLLGWTGADTFYKLSLAAFLHDMTLDSDDLSKIRDLPDLMADDNQFTEEEKKRYRLHPEQAADLAMKMSEIPADVHRIIREHHEYPDGSGFPQGLKHSELSPLGSVFIMAENLIHFQTQICTTPDLSFYINSISPSFNKGIFKGIAQALIDSTANKSH